MALKIKVMADKVNNLSDARYFAGMGTEWIAFDARPEAPGALSADKIAAMAAWLQGVKIVVETGGVSGPAVEQLLQTVTPDFVLDEEINGVARLRSAQDEDVYYVVNQANHAAELPAHKVLCRFAGTAGAEAEALVAQYGFAGIVISGGQEIAPGLKSFEEVAELLESLEED